MVILRQAIESDLRSILTIYNQGIEDRIATLETELKDESYMYEWFKNTRDATPYSSLKQIKSLLDGRPLMHTIPEVLMMGWVTFQSIFIVTIAARDRPTVASEIRGHR